jgi:septum site-determining protein MinD
MFMGKIIAVASGKGGTGKTTSVAAISSCLAVLGHKTLCIDFDAGLKNLDLSLSMADYTITDYMDVINERMTLMEACSESPQIQGLFFLAAPTVFEMDDPDEEKLKSMFAEIRREFDYCLVDAPSGIGSGFKWANANADMSIIVTTSELPAMRDAQRTASLVREMGIGSVRLLVNRIDPKNFKLTKTTVDDVIDMVGVQLLGIIPEDKFIFRALHASIPLVLYKKRYSAYDFLDVARRIAGESVPLRQG